MPPSPSPWASLQESRWGRYGLGTASVVLATLIQFSLVPLIGAKFPFASLFLAVLFSSWWGGFGAGLLSTIVGALSAAFFLVSPVGSIFIEGVENQFGMLIFLSVSSGMTLMGARMRQALAAAKSAIDAEREQAERLQVTLASIGDAVIATNSAGRITSINPVAESMTGWSTPDALGRPLSEVFHIVHEQPRIRVEDPVAKVLRAGRLVGLANHTLLISRDGRETPISDSASPIQTPDGAVIGVVLIFRDVSPQKHVEQVLELENRRKDEFLAMLAHELRNPLAPIRSGLELLSMSGVDPENVAIMKEQVDHLVQLVDDLLDISRIMGGKIRLRKEPVDVATAVRKAAEMARPLIETQRHEFVVSFPDEAVWIDGDPVRMAQVIANLLNNAAKYTDPGGRIELTVQIDRSSLPSTGAHETDARWVTITVRDNGLGIDPELLPRVFDLFTQADRSLERSQGGLGIGLTLVKRLVEMHGGTVTGHSDGAGRGSEFVIRLPALLHRKTGDAAAPVRANDQGLRILVVDDNAAAVRLLSVLLQKIGKHDVRVAKDGHTALRLADEFRPSLILLDIGLPRMNGYEVARQLRGNPDFDKTLLAASTGYGTEEDRRRSLSAGFDVHLIKPVSLDQLRELLAHPKLAK